MTPQIPHKGWKRGNHAASIDLGKSLMFGMAATAAAGATNLKDASEEPQRKAERSNSTVIDDETYNKFFKGLDGPRTSSKHAVGDLIR